MVTLFWKAHLMTIRILCHLMWYDDDCDDDTIVTLSLMEAICLWLVTQCEPILSAVPIVAQSSNNHVLPYSLAAAASGQAAG
jgi:hypothetical protein